MQLDVIHICDVREGLKLLPDESVHCIVTSPPYWGLRDYGIEPSVWDGEPECAHEWGEALERDSAPRRQIPHGDGRPVETDLYAQERIEVPTTRVSAQGCFCRLCGAWRGAHGLEPTVALYVDHTVEIFREVRRVLRKDGTLWLNLGDSYINSGGRHTHRSKGAIVHRPKGRTNARASDGLKEKDLAMVPARVALALQADGWFLRQDIIWSKPNPMPQSAKDRPTTSHEHIFLLSRSARYFYDGEAVKEESVSSPSDIRKMEEGLDRMGGKHLETVDPKLAASAATNIGRKRAVGFPTGRNRRSVWTIATCPYPDAHFATFPEEIPELCIRAGCPEGGVVLDPFGGSGTTGRVAKRLGRHFIMYELNPEYAQMGERRTINPFAPNSRRPTHSLFEED